VQKHQVPPQTDESLAAQIHIEKQKYQVVVFIICPVQQTRLSDQSHDFTVWLVKVRFPNQPPALLIFDSGNNFLYFKCDENLFVALECGM
jgi:hypothetical protein